MEPSDWIALGALGVAVASMMLSYLTHRADARARRVEIVTEKSIEAYREVVEKSQKLMESLPQERVNQSYALDPWELTRDVENTYVNYRLFFPTELAIELRLALRKFRLALKSDDEEFDTQLVDTVSMFVSLIERIQKHIGIETKEQVKSLPLPPP